MEPCQACLPKEPAWPAHLDFSNLAPYQKECPWCQGTREVTAEVACVYIRLKQDRGILSTRYNTLTARSLEAEMAAQEMQKRNRPRNISKQDWQQMIADAMEKAKEAKIYAFNAYVDLENFKTNGS